MVGIYAITNTETSPEKAYFGQSVSIRKRLQGHLASLLRGTHRNSHLQRSFNKYGKEAFIFAPFRLVENREDLTKWERYAIKEAKELGIETYNIRDPEIKAPLSEETRKKISNSKKGEKAYWFGKTLPNETKKKMSKAKLGNKHLLGHRPSTETKQKLSEAAKRDWIKRKNLGLQNKEI